METFYGWNLCVRGESSAWQSKQALEILQPDYWMNWRWSPGSVNHPNFVPMIWGRIDGYETAVQAALRAYPDNTWIFVNEAHHVEQANMTPTEAVDLTLQFINMAREAGVKMNWCGPNASVNMGRIYPQETPGAQWWREYLRELRGAGLARPSVHGIHMYHSISRSMLSHAWNTIRDEWRWQWIGDGPIVITEMCAENEPLAMQVEVMDEAFKLLELGLTDGPAGERGVLGVFWFVATGRTGGSGDWPNCALCEVDPGKTQTMRLTPLGEHWLALQARLR